jgi:hypothetical protein
MCIGHVGTARRRRRFTGMAHDHADDLDRELDRFSQRLPSWMGRFVHWVRRPSSRFVRIPLAIVLIGGGFVGFLPVLGFWMVPLGLVLIAQDVPFLRPPLARLIAWIDRKWPVKKQSAT